MGFLQDLCGNKGMVEKSQSKRRMSLNPNQKNQMSVNTTKQTFAMLVFQGVLVLLTLFSYTGFRVSGWTEFTARPELSIDGNFTVSRTNQKTIIFVKDVNSKLTIDDIRSDHQRWFSDNYYMKNNSITGERFTHEKHVYFKVMPAYQQATLTDVVADSVTGERTYTDYKKGWQAAVTFTTSMWDEGTSCHNPYGKADIGDNDDETFFDDLHPSELGDIVHYYGNQYQPVLSDDLDSDGKYYIKYIKYSQSKCMYLYRSYFLGAAAMSFSIIAFFTSLLFSALVYFHDPERNRFPPLRPMTKTGFRGCQLYCAWWCTSSWFFLKKRCPQLIGFICAISTGLPGIFSILSIAQMAGFHGHWYYFTMPWYMMGLVGFLDLYAFARMINIIHDFYVKGRKLRLQNVPEGLWARKVECGGPEGFKEEKRLGMSLEKVGNEIVVTGARGFAKTKGCLSDLEDEIGVSPYYAQNVQAGDVFLGIMTVATMTVREAKSPEETAQHDKILSAWDPDRLMFKEGSEFVGGNLTNQEYVMLQKPWKWRNLRSHKVYNFLQPHINPTIEDAEKLLKQAKLDANPVEEGVVGKPYWIITWRVNEEGVKMAQFPVPRACTTEEFAKLEYKSSPHLIQHQTLDDYTKSLGLDIEDLNPTTTQSSHIETQGVVILSTSGLSESMGLRADDVIVGVNYTPLTKAMTSRKFGGIIAEMPMPFVLNVSRKVKDYVPDSLDKEKNKQRQRDDLARFNQLLLLLVLLVSGLALSITATSSTEWTVSGRDPTSLADYGIGIWFASIAPKMDRSSEFQLALDRLVYCGDTYEGEDTGRRDDDGSWQACYTDRGSKYKGVDIFDMKIFTRIFTMAAVFFGLIGVFLITLLLLVGVDTVPAKIRKRYVTFSTVSSLLQAGCSMIGAYCWSFVHDSFRAKPENCLVEYTDGSLDWVVRANGEAVTDSSLTLEGTPLCLAFFRYGPAWQALVVAAFFTFLLSLDSLLSFTLYADNLTVNEMMEIAKKKIKARQKQLAFQQASENNEGHIQDNFEDKLLHAIHLGSPLGNGGVENLTHTMEEMTHGITDMTKGVTGGTMKRMNSTSAFVKGIVRSPTTEKA